MLHLLLCREGVRKQKVAELYTEVRFIRSISQVTEKRC